MANYNNQNWWWVFINRQTGAAVISPVPGVTDAITRAVGAKTPNGVVWYKYGGGFQSAVDNAIANHGLATEEIPISYIPAGPRQNFMGIAGNINNQPFNTGGLLTPNFTHKQAQSIDQTANAGINAIPDAINGLNDFLKLLAWFVNPLNALRVVEFLTGLLFVYIGIHSLVQAAGERRGRFYGYGGVIRRSPIGRVARLNRHETDVERVRRRGAERQERAGRNTDTGRESNRKKTRKYARSSERANRRSDRDSRRNAQRSKARG